MRLLLVACALALACTATAVGASPKAPAAPSGLHAFVYRADEPVKADHTYALMPAFAWKAVDGASNYELQLATSRMFSDATTLYDKSFGAPVASIQLQVPWMTGKPYALWARVRVVANGQTSRWGAPFGFNTAWQAIPQRQDAPDGLIRWSHRRGRDRIRGLVHERPGQLPDPLQDADERRRRARVLDLPPGRRKDHSVARSRDPPRHLGVAPERHSRRELRAVFATLHDDDLGRALGEQDPGDRRALERRVHSEGSQTPPADAGRRMERDARLRRHRRRLRVVARIRVQRQAVHQSGDDRLPDRRSCLGPPRGRPAEDARDRRGAQRIQERQVPGLRSAGQRLRG